MAKKVFKVFLIWLLSLLTATFFTLTLLCFSCPLYMAEKFERVGMNNFAYGCYDRAYHKTEQIDEQYIMFNKAVDVNFDSHIVFYGEKLLENENYNALCIAASLENIKQADNYILNNLSLTTNAKTRLKISVYNEDNYIKNRYVAALIATNKTYLAKEFAFGEVDKIVKQNTFNSSTVFCVLPIVNNGEKLNDTELEMLESLYNKFISNIEFDYGNLSFDEKVECQRICEISQCLSVAYGNLGNEEQSSQWDRISDFYYGEIYG